MSRHSRPQPGQLALFDEVADPAWGATTDPLPDERGAADEQRVADGEQPGLEVGFVADSEQLAPVDSARDERNAAPDLASGDLAIPRTHAPMTDTPNRAAPDVAMERTNTQGVRAVGAPMETSPRHAPDAPLSRQRRQGDRRSRYLAAPPGFRPRVAPSPEVTLDQAIPDYLTALAALGRSQHTLKSFELDLRLLRGQLGNRAVGSIEIGHLRQFIAWVRLSRDNAPNSLRRKVATLKNFFGYLRDEGYLASSPADLVPYPDAYVALPEFLEDDAAARLVEVTEGNTFWRALIILLLDTGLKRDEALALRVADLHLEPAPSQASYLVVRETDAAKRLRSRRLPLTPRLRDALGLYLHDAPGGEEREARGDGHMAHQPISASSSEPSSAAINHETPRGPRSGESRVFDVSVRGINFIVETCGSRAGIVTSKPRLTPQVLRETFAVARMRERVAEERRRRDEGIGAEALQYLSLQHDAEVLELLGLKDDPDTARKYRQLVKL